MQRAGPPPPLSPLSYSSNDSSFVGRYGGGLSGAGGAGTPTDPNFFPGPVRPPQTSPPSSGHPSSSTDMSRPSASSVGRPPSSASSMGMSSDGRMGGFSKPNPNRDSTRSQFNIDHEDTLARHYRTLKSYLSTYLAEEKANPKSNRARDKLLRLSVTQFMELSTDVFDELIRREDQRLGRVENVPHFLLPKQSFHPKRNQARQKLSTLPLDRFRQLATDVFYELERRIPRFAGPEQNRAPSRGGMRPPPPGYGGAPPFPPGGPRRPVPNGPYSPGLPPPGNRRPSEAASLGRPLPKTFQSNTIVPNKGTMVEEDDGSDDEDAFGLSGALSPRSPEGSAEDKEKIQAQELEIGDLKGKLESLESRLLEKEEELEKANGSEQDHDDERQQWHGLREELEQKAMDAQALNDSLQQELNHLRQSKVQELEERIEENEHLRRQLDAQQSSTNADDLEHRISLLQDELTAQEKITSEVREEATLYLQEMRDLSRQNDRAIEQEERLATKVNSLEKDISDWRQRYAKIKAQNRTLRASTMGLGLQTDLSSVRQSPLITPGGLVRDVDVTRFQLSVDELLSTAREPSLSPTTLLVPVKAVILAVQAITSSVGGTDDYPTPSPSPPGPQTSSSPPSSSQSPTSASRLKARVTGTANSLITAAKHHAAAAGLSPVALLDAAASNLTSAVVELLKAVRIRPSTPEELLDSHDARHGLPSATPAPHAHDPHLAAADHDDDAAGLASFYDDADSPLPRGDGPSHAGHQQQHEIQLGNEVDDFLAQAPAVPTRGDAGKPPPLRTNSTKKGNGWFGWGKKGQVDGEEGEEGEFR